MNLLSVLTLALAIAGALNWGLVGLLDFDLVVALSGARSLFTRIVYVVLGLSAVWQVMPLVSALGSSEHAAGRAG